MKQNHNESHLLHHLKKTQEEQWENEQNLRDINHHQEHLNHLRKKSNQLFSSLLDSWKDDKHFSKAIYDYKQQVALDEQKLAKGLAAEQQKLTQKQQTLDQVESQLYQKHRILRQEEPR